jgi:hypothetical protein
MPIEIDASRSREAWQDLTSRGFSVPETTADPSLPANVQAGSDSSIDLSPVFSHSAYQWLPGRGQ